MAFESLDSFFADFGIAATVGAVSLVGVFDNDYGDPLGLVAGARKVLTIQSADAPTVAVGTSVVVSGTTYSVAAIEPDGTGLSRLVLK